MEKYLSTTDETLYSLLLVWCQFTIPQLCACCFNSSINSALFSRHSSLKCHASVQRGLRNVIYMSLTKSNLIWAPPPWCLEQKEAIHQTIFPLHVKKIVWEWGWSLGVRSENTGTLLAWSPPVYYDRQSILLSLSPLISTPKKGIWWWYSSVVNCVETVAQMGQEGIHSCFPVRSHCKCVYASHTHILADT